MKRFGFLLSLLAVSLLGGNVFAQGDNSVYFTTYYSNANTHGAPDGVLRIINDGSYTGSPYRNLWAAIYVFDDQEELQDCCACGVTPDGLLSESVNKNLTANAFRGVLPTRGVIKVVSIPGDDPTNIFPTPGLRVWATHVQATSNEPEKGPFFMTESLAADSNLTAEEQSALENACAYNATLSGLPCTCTSEGYDY